jgi:NADH dehydrogenase
MEKALNVRPRVAIVGAGFGGLRAAKELKGLPVDVVLIDQNNYHTFQPLLYQVATAALDPEEIAHNVRGVFHRQGNFSFRLGRVAGVDWTASELAMADGAPVRFDYLVLAAGTVTSTFGVPGVEQHAFPLKSMDEAVRLRSHVMRQFEVADADPGLAGQGALTFVVVGGGPTGVEMAGALAEWFHLVLRKDYPRLDMAQARVVLLEALDGLLMPFHPSLRANARRVLERRGVEVKLGEAVAEVTSDGVRLRSGGFIPARTVVWGAGVRASPLGAALGLELSRGGRVAVNPDLGVPGHPRVYAIGDMAAGRGPDGQPYPQLAQVAIQGARHVARQIERHLRGESGQPFVYHDPGTMATIGRNAAVAQFPIGWRFTGVIAWLMWAFLHLAFLIGGRNRLNVFVNWAWNYFTYDRSQRLIVSTTTTATSTSTSTLPLSQS